jgi:hypothetical protein
MDAIGGISMLLLSSADIPLFLLAGIFLYFDLVILFGWQWGQTDINIWPNKVKQNLNSL